jgi:hypothetical protein
MLPEWRQALRSETQVLTAFALVTPGCAGSRSVGRIRGRQSDAGDTRGCNRKRSGTAVMPAEADRVVGRDW